jgi:hypothetical protein
METLATYRLTPKREPGDLTDKQYFFWKSGSSFEYALSKNSWLKERTHFCGPGKHPEDFGEHGVEPHVFLDHSQWLKEMARTGAIATGP